MRLKARCQKRREPGEMTLTEKRYKDVLETMKRFGEIQEWAFEVVTLVLAKDLRYTPDFRVILADGTEVFVEVKPANWKHIPNQANSTSKIKMAAELHPYIFWRAVERTKRDGGGFEVEVIEGR